MSTLSNQTELQLPFSGSWLCYQGDEHGSPDQRFARDFIKIDDFENRHRGARRTNEASLSYGQAILAPGPGVIIDAIDGRQDNRPGTLSRARNILGNYVLLGHTEDEFSVLAHLKKDSLAVEIGETVVRGQKLAECGNSGRSRDPHIHYQLQNSSELAWQLPKDTKRTDMPSGIKVYFSDILLERCQEGIIEPRKRHSPVMGDIVEQPL